MSASDVPSAGNRRREAPVLSPSFSHIYVERAALEYADAKRVLDLYPDAVCIPIDDYKEVFNRSGQRFQIQKALPKLILAVKRDGLLYRGSERIESFGDRNLSYNSLVRNCLYNCDYCFLQGMHPSAHIVVFVNNEDFLRAADEELAHGPLYLSLSYLTDLLAFEGIVPFCRRWIEAVAARPGLTVEIRTKSDNYRAISDLHPQSRVVLSWTLSPEGIAAAYERGTASFKNRLFALRAALADGWRVRVCLDPLLRIAGWREAYEECIDEIARRVDLRAIEGWSIGTLRMPNTYLKRILSDRKDSDILYHPFQVERGNVAYSRAEDLEMKNAVTEMLTRGVERSKITLVGSG